MRVLVAEDDTRLAVLLTQALTEAGWEVEAVGDGRSAYGRALHGAPPVSVAVDTVVDRDTRWARLRVADAGPGMDADLLATATERFTRADDARSRPGAGLGLALVETLVLGAGGRLRLCAHGTHRGVGPATSLPCEHDERMTVTVLLPQVSPPPDPASQ
jgi:signal transduction histidine kinase